MAAERQKGDGPTVAVTAEGLCLTDAEGRRQHRPLLSGAMHYYHHRRADWGACLEGLAGLGLSIVDTAVPWMVHEREAGSWVFDCDRFAGDRFAGDGERYCRNLVAFIEACAERDLALVLRPGPGVGAELTGFGYPERILADEACLARGARGNPVIMPAPPRFFPVPSLASERFLGEAERWLAAVADAVAPYVWPDGPVIGLLLGSEPSLQLRDAAYDQDYHEGAVTLFRRYLGERYGAGDGDERTAELPPGYRAELAEVEPPRRMDARTPEELVPHLDWVAFKPWLVQRALDRFATAVRRAAPPLRRVPLMHQVTSTAAGGGFGLAAVERRLELTGIGLHLQGRDYRAVRRAARHAAGSSRLPYLGEIGWGGWAWWLPQTLHDQLANALAALMHGVRGFNLQMAVERDRWFGAPISARGEVHTERHETTRRLVAAVEESELPALSRGVTVGVLRVAAYRRLALCASLIDPVPPLPLSYLKISPREYASPDTFGLSGPIQHEHERFVDWIEEALDELDLDFHVIDCCVAAERLARYRLLIVPSFDFLGRKLLARLVAYAEGGGRLLFGPRAPTLDEAMRPLVDPLPPHRLARDQHELAEGLGELADELELAPPLSCDQTSVELSCFAAKEGGEPRVVFAVNRAETSCVAAIHGLGVERRWVWDAISGDPVDPRSLHLEPGQVRMLRLRPVAGDDRRGDGPEVGR